MLRMIDQLHLNTFLMGFISFQGDKEEKIFIEEKGKVERGFFCLNPGVRENSTKGTPR